MSTEVFLNEFAEISEHPYRILSQYKKEGKKVIGVLPYYAPAELVVAAGMVPMGMIKRQFGTTAKVDEINKLLGEQIYKYVKDNNIQMLVPDTVEQ